MTIETTDGTLLGGRIRFRQPAAGYRSAIDPVFLAAAVPARAGDRVFELGLGAGAAALCLLARVPHCTVAGVEPDPVLRRLALENAAANGLDGRLTAVADTAALDAAGAPFDHLMSNPPFWAEGSGNRSPDARKARANYERDLSIDGWVDELCRLCRPGGRPKATATMVYAAARLDDLLAALCGAVRRAGDFAAVAQGRPGRQAGPGPRAPRRQGPGAAAARPDAARGGRPLHPGGRGRAARRRPDRLLSLEFRAANPPLIPGNSSAKGCAGRAGCRKAARF